MAKKTPSKPEKAQKKKKKKRTRESEAARLRKFRAEHPEYRERERARLRLLSRKKQQEKAAAELADRELARRHLLHFIRRMMPSYKPGWVHKDICTRLEAFSDAVARGESPRLMIFMPPRHGKSLIASQFFPLWHLSRHPDHEIIQASYAQSLQLDFSKRIQENLRSHEYRKIFPGIRIAKGSEAAERWQLSTEDPDTGTYRRTGGGLLAAGVGGPITGRGAHIFSIDDPVKNREEADSSVVQEATKNWYSSTAYTRLAPGGGVLVIQTRWHDNDLSGWLLSLMREAEKEYKETGVWPDDADRWDVVEYPALATRDEKYRRKGDALHEERYSRAALLKIKRTLSPRDWAALYQQTPVVEEGAFFQKPWLRFYKSQPTDLYVICCGDLAISKSEQADFSVFMIAGLDPQGRIYMLDERRGRWTADEIIDQIFDIQRVWRPRFFGLEKGHISMAIGPQIDYRRRKEGLHELVIEELKPGKRDKELRARAIQGRMQLGEVYYPEGALWVAEHVNELLRFPNGVNDDRVDAIAWIGLALAEISYQGTGKQKRDKSWRKRLAGYMRQSKRTPRPYMAA